MATKYTINSGNLRATARELEGYAAEYKNEYEGVISDVNSLDATWKDGGNREFLQKVEEFRDDFEKMKEAILDYVEMLTTTASQYEGATGSVQDVIKGIVTDLNMRQN